MEYTKGQEEKEKTKKHIKEKNPSSGNCGHWRQVRIGVEAMSKEQCSVGGLPRRWRWSYCSLYTFFFSFFPLSPLFPSLPLLPFYILLIFSPLFSFSYISHFLPFFILFFLSSFCKCVSFFECSWQLSVVFTISLEVLSSVL